jgi:nucleoside-diphosphate-sugar epimerase
MRVVIIGGSGHVGTYLVPRLVEAGHEVINVARGQRDPYLPHAAWKQVKQVIINRDEADAQHSFGQQIQSMKPDIVIDMICFTLDSTRQLVEALRGQVQHFLHCGTIWMHGHSVQVPTTEEQPRQPFGEYGIQKSAIEAYLMDEARRNGFPATALHPGHIVGEGWNPLNPAGHFNPQVFVKRNLPCRTSDWKPYIMSMPTMWRSRLCRPSPTGTTLSVKVSMSFHRQR